MKQFFTFLMLALLTVTAQAQQSLSYQSLVRDAEGDPLANSEVFLRFSIREIVPTGTVIYQETHEAETDQFGWFSVNIGLGSPILGDFENINWHGNIKYLEVEIKETLSAPYEHAGVSMLNSSPYMGAPGIAGPQGLLPDGSVAGNTPYWNGTAWIVNNSNIHNNGAGVGIGTTNPNASAKVEIESTTQGFLPPRMTTAQRDAIALPAAGLTIYNTTENCLQWWNGNIWYDGCGNNAPTQPQYPIGSVFCASEPTTVVEVTNPTTGKIWMDRNLGATQVATSGTDQAAYGDLYQWGRRSDGHQCRTSPTTTTLSSTDQPGHGDFILVPNFPSDWLSPQNTNLWQGANGINNPCPAGYRLPTETELSAERTSWSSNNAAGAFASPLKLPLAGYRLSSLGSLNFIDTNGYYWSSTVSGFFSLYLEFNSSIAFMNTNPRAYGRSVRCLKD